MDTCSLTSPISWLHRLGFDREVQETVRRGVRERHPLDNIVLEINSLKYAYDTTFLDCASSIFVALVSLIEEADFNNSLKNVCSFNEEHFFCSFYKQNEKK
jgi:hypothetical protein